MFYPLAAQKSLENFYVSVQFSNPAIGAMMADDIRTVALYGIGGDRRQAYSAVSRLQERAHSLPPVFERILQHALEDLGYSLLDVEMARRESLA